MNKCDNCANAAAYVLDVSWLLPQYFCESCLPGALRFQFGPEQLKVIPAELPVEELVEAPVVEAVAEPVVEETPAPAPKKKKSAVAVEEAVAEDVEQVAANVSDN